MNSRGNSSYRAHRQRRSRRWFSMLLAGGVAFAVSAGITVSTPSTTYSAAIRLAGTTIGVGPSYDAFGLTIPMMFYGSIVPDGDAFHTVPYPAQISISIPIISDLPGLSDLPYWTQSLKRSEAIGAGYLLRDIAATASDDTVKIIGVSQGTQVAEIARTEMSKLTEYTANADDYEFVFIGDPYQPNGGILSRLASWSDVPVLGHIFPFGRPGPTDSPFKTTYYQNQYDGIADFPAYFNVLSITNSFAGQAFGHLFPGYVLEYPDAPNAVTTQVGNSTYVTLPQYLPLLAPLRIPASLIGAERFVDAMDPVLRVFVEMGYDRTADPSKVKEFSWITPDDKVAEALNGLPGAFRKSAAILRGEPYTPTMPQPVITDTAPDTPLPEHPAEPVGTSPFEQRLRGATEDIGAMLSNATRPLAGVFQAIGEKSLPQKAVEPVGRSTIGRSVPFNRLDRTATAQADSTRSDEVRRLRPVRATTDSDRDSVRAAVRSNARSNVDSAKPAPKPGPGQRHDRSKHRSDRAG
ncbi:PE-PPE domain-containing protein [Mycobacterium sp. URHD0025]|uniref:PE-PPE domain-containing protein n=1 Tax=Mycobacterium sp. URHD0025 TaxID=1298864 RepID=UPI00048E5C46|nr:PE-PPE domain-containing protein [Mycobacterium sp. URHD0025]